MQKSYLNIIDTETGEVTLVKTYDRIIEAPNWSARNNCLYYNSEGKIYRYNLDTGEDVKIDTGICTDCNNDHVLSPDETQIAVSNNADHDWLQCQIYICPIEGGEATLVTPTKPSFLHGWSKATNELCYCAFRMIDGVNHVDIYKTAAPRVKSAAPDGTAAPHTCNETSTEIRDKAVTPNTENFTETRLTSEGFNDGPEFSPDGKHIWYNSTASGLMQVWRMNADGTDKTQMTDNDKNNWFPHISPDGRKVVYLAFNKEDLEPEEHLPNLHVELWLMDYDGSNKRKLLSLFGGQGTINVNSWSDDSRKIAFVSYEKLK